MMCCKILGIREKEMLKFLEEAGHGKCERYGHGRHGFYVLYFRAKEVGIIISPSPPQHTEVQAITIAEGNSCTIG